ncbi:hypothetical protein Vafri_15677, partial [Volvox africanus]
DPRDSSRAAARCCREPTARISGSTALSLSTSSLPAAAAAATGSAAARSSRSNPPPRTNLSSTACASLPLATAAPAAAGNLARAKASAVKICRAYASHRATCARASKSAPGAASDNKAGEAGEVSLPTCPRMASRPLHSPDVERNRETGREAAVGWRHMAARTCKAQARTCEGGARVRSEANTKKKKKAN